MSSDWAEPLDDLRWHYGEAYLIDYLSGRWIAQRRDSHETMSADSPAGLLDRIRADYAAHPVSRQNQTNHDRFGQTPDCRFRPEG